MDINLRDRVALVTGGGRGIGRAIALSLAKAGASVAVNYRRDKDSAAEVIAAIAKLDRKAKSYCASVEDLADDARMVADVVRDFGHIDILVNNAGIASRGHTVADTDPEEMERVIRVHAIAPYYLSKLALPHMRKRARGDIVMISSIATLKNSANGAPYNMAKAAMEALALTLAKEERGHNIRTNIVAPSLTVTEMGSRLAKATSGISDIAQLNAKSPFGRVSVPDDVASVVTFLVSEASAYVNGQKINIDGGGT